MGYFGVARTRIALGHSSGLEGLDLQLKVQGPRKVDEVDRTRIDARMDGYSDKDKDKDLWTWTSN